MRKYLVLTALVLLSLSTVTKALAMEKMAQVLQISGHVTQLPRGGLKVRKLNIGEYISRDTSIVTGKNGFAQIVIIGNNSRINVGPNTKIVIDQIVDQNVGFINLLNGRIRAEVEKNHVETKNKLYVRTRTAMMGVKGTDFLVIYNARNKVTSLLSFEGEVYMSKLLESEDPIRLRHSRIFKYRQRQQHNLAAGDIDIVEERKAITAEESKMVDNAITDEDAVVVKAGQFSSAAVAIKKVSRPVKISPVQFSILADNHKLLQINKDFNPVDPTILNERTVTRIQQEQDTPAEGFYNTKTGNFALKAGGYIDLDTGVYVAPGPHSEFNARYRVYLDNTNGQIDKSTGQYLPPEGIGLHMEKGFLPLNKKYKKDPDIIAKVHALNASIARDILLVKSVEFKKEEEDLFASKKELFTKDQLILSFKPSSKVINVTSSPYVGSKKLVSSSFYILDLSWYHNSNTKWQIVTRIANKYVKMDLAQNPTINAASSNSLWMASVGVRWALSARWDFLHEWQVDENYYLLHPNDNGSVSNEIKKVTSTRAKFIFEAQWLRTDRFSLDTDIGFHVALPKDLDTTSQVGLSYGPWLGAGVKWWFSPKWWSKVEYWYYSDTQKVEYSTYSYDHARATSGLAISFSRVY